MVALGKRKRGDVKGTRRGQNRPRKAMRMTMKRTVRPQFLTVKRTYWSELWAPNSTTTNGFWRYFAPTFASLPSRAEFQALFDLYRICGIKYTFRPKFNEFAGNDVTTPGTTDRGYLSVGTLVDTSSGTAAPAGTYNATTWNTFAEQGNVKIRRGTRDISVYFKPSVLGTINGIVTKPMYNQWASTSNDTITHRGLHVFISDQNFSGVFSQAFDVFITYYMQFKGTK